MINDDIIKEYYKNKVIHSWNNIPQEHKEYLKYRFTDSESYKESVWRILYNIEIRPICPVCGNKIKFIGRKNNIFSKTCSNECFRKILTIEKPEKTEEELYYDSLSKIEKIKYTNLKKYGVEFAAQLDTNNFKRNNPQKLQSIKDKTRETRIKKYKQYFSPNNLYILKTDEIKKKRIESINKTLLKKYGTIKYRNLDKYKETCLLKYKVDHYFKTKQYKEYIISKQKEIINKISNTKKKNKTYNTSKIEDQSYILLKEKYTDVLRQYRSKLYPFNCDFYIPSLDLYIECQYGQFHHKRPYIGNEQDLKDIEILKEKANRICEQNNVKLSRYDIELETWTLRDVKKRNTAKQNNLNYIEFWNINELKNWLNSN